MKLKQFMFALVAMVLGFAMPTSAQVAKVGYIEYATIDEAIANWTNGTTLTLLADVTLSDVIKLSSTEYHILDLGTYTMTAAKNKDAIQYVVNGRSSAGNALDIKADANNPGGITATGGSIVRHTKPLTSAPSKDRPITRFYGGVFNASYIVRQGGTFGAGYTGANAPYFYFYGGEFNGTVYANRSIVHFYGGTFNGNIQISVDSSSYGLVSGGKFKSLSNAMGSELNSGKFTIGSAKGTYDRGIYVDANGYYVVTSDVITEVSAKYPAVKKESYNSNNYFYYSAAATYGMFYEVASMAGTGSNVTVWEKPVVTIPENVEGDATVVEEIKKNTALNDYTPVNLPEGAELEIVLESVGETFVYDVTPMANGVEVEPTEAITFRLPVPASVTTAYAKVYHEGELMGIYEIKGEGNAKYVEISSADFSVYTVEPTTPVAKIGETPYATLADAVAAAQNNATITLIDNVVLAERVTIPADKTLTINLNGKSISMEESIIATAYAINNLGNLTITDGVGGGSINARGMYNGYGDGGENVASATMTILGGTFNAKGTNGGAAIFNYGTANVNAGTFTSIGGYSLNNQAGSTMTIADGVSANNGVYNSNATLTIDGGEISGNRSGCHVIYAWNSTLTINGGTLHNNNAGNATILADGEANVTINGGTFSINNGQQTHGWTSCLLDANGGATYVITDGEFKGHFRVQANSSMEISGGTFEDTHNSGYAIYGTTVVKGGTFTDDTAKAFATKYIAEGYGLNEEGTVKKIVVAKIGEVGYATLEEALTVANAVVDAQVTITLLADIETFNGDDIVADVVLDLNGKTVTSTGSYFFWLDNGKLTIKDSSTEQTGKLNGVTTGNAVLLYGNSTLVVENGAIYSNNNVVTTFNQGNTVVFNGGEFKANSATPNSAVLYLAGSESTVTVNNGTFIGDIPFNYGTFVVNGGVFTKDVNNYCASGYTTQLNTETGMYEIVEKPAVPTVPAEEAKAKLGKNYYATVENALEAAGEQGLTNVVITIVGENSSTTADKFNLSYKTEFDNVTFKQENGNKPYYFAGLYTGSRTNNGKFVFDGVNIAVPSNGQYMFEGNVVLSNNSYIKSSAEANCFVYNAEVTVEAGSKIDGVIEDIRGGSLIIDGGKTDGTYCEEPAFRDAILIVNWASSNLVLKNGAYVKVNAANDVGRLTVNGKMDVSNSKLESYQWIEVNQGATLTLNAGSVITTKELKGAGAINIDATGITGDVTVIKANLTGFTGAINVEGGTYEITDEGLVVKMPVLAGEGTEANPYLISSVDELVFFRDHVNAGKTKYNAEGVYVALGANIDLAGIDWSVNIGDDCNATFDGIFDGKNFTISNLTATETAKKGDGYICTGLFGAIYGDAVVKNLTLENVTIDARYAGNNVAAVVGFAYNAEGSIENVKVIGTINIYAPSATGVGAIVGYDYACTALKVVNCEVKGNDGSAIVGKSYVGGVVGYASSKIELNANAVENVSVTGTGSVGAVAGIMLDGSSATGNTVKYVTLSATGELWANSVAVVAGTITKGSVTAANTTVENVTANGKEAPIVGGVLVEKPTTPIEKVQAKIGNVYFATIDAAMASNVNGVVDIFTDVTLNDSDANGYTFTKEAKVNGKLTYTREFSQYGSWNALYLPFEVPVADLLENYNIAYLNDVHSFDDNEDGEIDRYVMEHIKVKKGTLRANFPYLIYPKNEGAQNLTITIEDGATLCKAEENTVECSSVFTRYSVKGIYQPITGSDFAGKYALTPDGAWMMAREEDTLGAYRLVMTITDQNGEPVIIDQTKQSIRIAIRGEGDLTDLEEVELNTNGETLIFDLQGRRVTTPAKGGVYIVNGKKIYFNK